jgi:sugar diacid utilization regulator
MASHTAPAPTTQAATGLAESQREQMSLLRSLGALSMIMTESRDEAEILRLAVTTVPALADAHVEGAWLLRGNTLECAVRQGAPGNVDGQLAALGGRDGELSLADRAWAFAYSLASPGGNRGHLVVSAHVPPTAEQQFLIGELAQQTGTALGNAAVVRELAVVNGQLAETVATLQESGRIHDVFTKVSAAGAGLDGIVEAVYRLTGLAAFVEDLSGSLWAWAGPDQAEVPPSLDSGRRSALLLYAQRQGSPTRDGTRLIQLAQSRDSILGVLGVLDPDAKADQLTMVALEHGATVLAVELAHRRSLAEMQVRLSRDLVEDLIAAVDSDGVQERAHAVGFDIRAGVRVLTINWATSDAEARVPAALARVTGRLNAHVLIGRRPGFCVALTSGRDDQADELHAALSAELGTRRGIIGVSEHCTTCADVPRGFQEATTAMAVRQGAYDTHGVARFRELGIFRLLMSSDDQSELHGFVSHWLGPLVAYDAEHKSDLVRTLSVHLDCGGNYDLTASALSIHRSTLRYRLKRIRDVSGLDINETESRLNLHVATRAHRLFAFGPC